MTEHVHEWNITPYGIKCFDPDCDEQLPSGEGDRRLNATERLSAGRASLIAKYGKCDHYDSAALQDYADILEGK